MKMIVIRCILGGFLIICYLQFIPWHELKVTSSFQSSSANEYNETLFIDTNMLIMHEDRIAKKVISKYVDNDYKNIMFSFGSKGYPTSVKAVVNRKLFTGQRILDPIEIQFTFDSERHGYYWEVLE